MIDQVALKVALKDLQLLYDQYESRDIYNMDETGLFWKAMPDRTLALEALASGKRAKSHNCQYML
jgi:hypothetical protein